MARPQFYLLLVTVFVSGLFKFCLASVSKGDATQRFQFCVTRQLSKSSSFSDDDLTRLGKTGLRVHDQDLLPDSSMVRFFLESVRDMVDSSDLPHFLERRRDALAALEQCSPTLVKSINDDLADQLLSVFSSMNSKKSLYVPTTEDGSFPEAKGGTVPRKTKASRVRRKRSAFDFSPPVIFNAPINQQNPLPTTIAGILGNAPIFIKTMNAFLPRQDAIRYSRAMAEAGLSNYGPVVRNSAIQSVTNSVSSLDMFPNTRDYSVAIANSVFNTLQFHELHYFANGNEIASLMLSKLQDLLNTERSPAPALARFDQPQPNPFGGQSTFYQAPSGGGWGEGASSFATSSQVAPFVQTFQQESPASSRTSAGAYGQTFPVGSSGSDGQSFGAYQPESGYRSVAPASGFAQTGWGERNYGTQAQANQFSAIQPNPDFQSHSDRVVSFQPQTNPKDEFKNSLSFFLSGNDKVTSVFCNGPAEGVFRMVNSGLSDFDPEISISAATRCNSEIRKLSSDAACVQFYNVLSDIISATLAENNVLGGADAFQISNKMASNIGPQQEAVPVEDGGPLTSYELQPSFYPASQPESFSAAETPMNYESFFPVEQPPEIQAPDYIAPDMGIQPLPVEIGQDSQARNPLAPMSEPEINPSFDAGYQPAVPSGPETISDSVDSYTNVETANIPTNEPTSSSTLSNEANSTPYVTSQDVSYASESQSSTWDYSSTTDELRSQSSYSSASTASEEVSTEVSDISSVPTPTPESSNEDTPNGSEYVKIPMTPSPTISSTSPDLYVRSLSESVGDQKKLSEMLLGEFNSHLEAIKDIKEENKKSSLQPPPPAAEATDDQDISMLLDMILSIVKSSIAYIKSDSYNLNALCSKANALASLVDIAPVDSCSELALVDYLLHILREVSIIFKNA